MSWSATGCQRQVCLWGGGEGRAGPHTAVGATQRQRAGVVGRGSCDEASERRRAKAAHRCTSVHEGFRNRTKGDSTAPAIAERLQKAGYKVFLDVDNLEV